MKLFIFGATGDLAKRKVFPALAAMGREDIEIIALGRKDLGELEFPSLDIKYERVDFNESLTCAGCEQHLEKNEIAYFYSALPPAQQELVVRYVAAVMHDGYPVRLLLEKPFSHDLAGAVHLQALIEKLGLGEYVYLSDHYLFKENILKLAPREFKKLEIVVRETEGVGERLAYYDGVGALRDMIQSHFLNVAFKLVPDPISEFLNIQISKYKREQYMGYTEELGRESQTETYVDLELSTKSHTYHFETGKKFEKREAYMSIDPSTSLGTSERLDLDAGPNPYIRIFADFLADKRENFATIPNAILAWQIIEKIEEEKPKLS